MGDGDGYTRVKLCRYTASSHADGHAPILDGTVLVSWRYVLGTDIATVQRELDRSARIDRGRVVRRVLGSIMIGIGVSIGVLGVGLIAVWIGRAIG